MTLRQARSGFTALSRCRAWLQRLVDDRAYDEWEEDIGPASQEPEVTRVPDALIDEMLGGDGPTRGEGGPAPG